MPRLGTGLTAAVPSLSRVDKGLLLQICKPAAALSVLHEYMLFTLELVPAADRHFDASNAPFAARPGHPIS